MLDNPVPTPLHYYSNPADPSNTQEQVGIFQSVGTVDVHGTAGVTNVLISPPAGMTAFSFVDEDSTDRLLAGGETEVPYLSSEQYLTNSVLGDVDVANAAIDIEGDNSNTLAAPPVLANVVVTQTEVTGLTGGIIHMSNLSNMRTSSMQTSIHQYRKTAVLRPASTSICPVMEPPASRSRTRRPAS